jgi:hypothetical protein
MGGPQGRSGRGGEKEKTLFFLQSYIIFIIYVLICGGLL